MTIDYTTYAATIHALCGTPEECKRLRAENAALHVELAELSTLCTDRVRDLDFEYRGRKEAEATVEKLRDDLHDAELALSRACMERDALRPHCPPDGGDKRTDIDLSYREVDAALRRINAAQRERLIHTDDLPY